MLTEYTTLLIYMLVIGALCIILPLFSTSVVLQENYQEKISPYECGFEPFEPSIAQFEIRYYLLAILFLIFDLEIVFLLPWLLTFNYLVLYGVVSMLVFFFSFY